MERPGSVKLQGHVVSLNVNKEFLLVKWILVVVNIALKPLISLQGILIDGKC
jgi:hypothetical protein